MRRLLTVGLAAGLLFSLFSFAPAAPAFADESIPYGGTLRIVGQWGTVPHNFNPFLAAGQNAPGTATALYESLFHVNGLNGDIDPVLGLSYQWAENNLKLVVEVRKGVTWSDGTPFTAEDVAFTFNYMKEHPALDLSGVWSNGLSAVEAPDETTVVFSFSQLNTPLFPYIAEQLIAPKHIWADVESPVTFTNDAPVVTGPFVLESYSPQAVTYANNPSYWMEDKPYVDQVSYLAAKSNNTALLMLLRKQVDYSHLNIPDPETTYVARDPEHNKYWWPVTNTNILYLNGTKAPFDDAAFRRALAHAIDKEALSEKAYFGVIDAAHPTGIIPGQRAKWVDDSLTAFFYDYDLEMAKWILSDAGYTWDDSGSLVDPDGETVPALRILVGAGWTDFISMAQIISQNLKEIGIEMVIEQEPWNSYINSLMGGTYDTAISWGTGTGPTPYDLYYRTLASEFAGLDGGQAKSNYSRYVNEELDEALAAFRETSDEAAQREAISTIQEIVVTDVPFIPLTNRTNFNDYQTARFVSWPTDDNPYNGGDPGDALGSRFMLLNVHLKK